MALEAPRSPAIDDYGEHEQYRTVWWPPVSSVTVHWGKEIPKPLEISEPSFELVKHAVVGHKVGEHEVSNKWCLTSSLSHGDPVGTSTHSVT